MTIAVTSCQGKVAWEPVAPALYPTIPVVSHRWALQGEKKKKEREGGIMAGITLYP